MQGTRLSNLFGKELNARVEVASHNRLTGVSLVWCPRGKVTEPAERIERRLVFGDKDIISIQRNNEDIDDQNVFVNSFTYFSFNR